MKLLSLDDFLQLFLFFLVLKLPLCTNCVAFGLEQTFIPLIKRKLALFGELKCHPLPVP